MPSAIALALFVVFASCLFCFDPAKDRGVSKALWVPLIWMFIMGSRLPSQWFGGGIGGIRAGTLEEGNAFDRSIWLALIVLAAGILLSRSINWGDLLNRNAPLVLFICFGFLSVLWSDYAFVSFKRWFRDLGNYLVVLVTLSDLHPFEAVRTLLRRLFYLLIPLSVILVKYYPEIGRFYNWWNGSAEYVGVTTSKNMLGVACLLSGLFFFWDTVTRWPNRRERRTLQVILINILLMAMTLWLLSLADSATSRVCLILGCLVIAAAHSKTVKRQPALLTTLILLGILLYPVIEFGLGISMKVLIASAVGRDPSLTDRTRIWEAVLGMETNVLVGTGYESFWLGPRLLEAWQRSGVFGINNAHNGYIELYLNLGIIGVLLLCGVLFTNYGEICRRMATGSTFASLSLALWSVLLFYNYTEAAFKSQLVWMTFLFAAVIVQRRSGMSDRPMRRSRSYRVIKSRSAEGATVAVHSNR